MAATAQVAPRPTAPKLSEEEEANRTSAERCLWYWNLAMGIMHLTWAVACLAFGLGKGRAGQFRVPTITTYPDWSGAHGPVPAMQPRHLVPFTVVTSLFSWISASAHFLALAIFPTYVRDLRKGINRFRWFEYSVSSSLMIVLIAMLFGIWDVHIQFLLGSINACMNLFGYAHEVQNPPGQKVDWSNFIFGCFAGACPWAVVLSYVVNTNVDGVPAFVWAILGGYFFFFNTFPVNMVFQYAQIGHWYKDSAHGFPGGGYYFGERVYQILSLVAKSFLLWLVVGGTNQPSTTVP